MKRQHQHKVKGPKGVRGGGSPVEPSRTAARDRPQRHPPRGQASDHDVLASARPVESAPRRTLTDAVPHDPALTERASEMWLSARWQALRQIETQDLAYHPDRGQLVALLAAASVQLGDRRAARLQARQALDWGCSREALAQVLLASTRHTLARASYLARREQRADAHFERSVGAARLSSEVRRLAHRRRDDIAAELNAAKQTAAMLRMSGARPATLAAPGWLTALAVQCHSGPDLHDGVDEVLNGTLTMADDRVQFLMLLSDRLLAAGDRMTAVHFLNAARPYLDEVESGLRHDLTRKLVALGAVDRAVEVIVQSALTRADPHGLVAGQDGSAVANAVKGAYQRMQSAAQAGTEHGHDLLLSFLERECHGLQGLAAGRRLTLIEVGTTREDVPGQGSTRKLAEYCQRRDIHFITVDMDPHNSRMARDLFKGLGVDFEAITMKGEDYLRDRTGPTDLVFLDAYDYDHGKHSELRQSRYEKFLGARIDEQACHRMHLQCAESLAEKLWSHGLVCVDNTWLNDGRWTAKGTLAMPYLLANGFTLVEARNRAALLVRDASVPG